MYPKRIRSLIFYFVVCLCYAEAAEVADLNDANDKCIKSVELLKQGGDILEGVRALTELSDSGFAPAMHLKGMMYLQGTYGIVKDLNAGFNLVKRSAELDYVPAMAELSQCYSTAKGTKENPRLAFEWAKKASSYVSPHAWSILGVCYEEGYGVAADLNQAVDWYRKSAGAGHPFGQWYYGVLLQSGKGVKMDEALALRYFRAAALQRLSMAQYSMGVAYLKGYGVEVSIPEGTAWMKLAAESGQEDAAVFIEKMNYSALPPQLRQHVGNRVASLKSEIAATPRVRDGPEPWSSPKRNPGAILPGGKVKWTGSGFIVTSKGHIITNQHVAPKGAKVKVITRFGAMTGEVLKSDEDNDFSLLKVEGTYVPIALSRSHGVRLGATVATIGFPNTEMQGYSPKLTKGEISSLAGLMDDMRYFQISVPVQPGNSGGALFDTFGNVIGVVTAKLNQRAAIAQTGTIAENVNYAIKSDRLISFLESVPEVFAQLPKPAQSPSDFEDNVARAENSTVLILVY